MLIASFYWTCGDITIWVYFSLFLSMLISVLFLYYVWGLFLSLSSSITDNNHLRGFLGTHRNIYNVYKRSQVESTRRKEKYLHWTDWCISFALSFICLLLASCIFFIDFKKKADILGTCIWRNIASSTVLYRFCPNIFSIFNSIIFCPPLGNVKRSSQGFIPALGGTPRNINKRECSFHRYKNMIFICNVLHL